MQSKFHAVLFAAVVLCAALAGCQTLDTNPGGQTSPAVYAQQLAQLDGEQLSTALENARAAYERDDSAANLARQGLVRGQWGYPGYAPAQAAQDLQAAASQPGAYWQAEQRAFLEFQAAQLQYIADHDSRNSATATQNRQLQIELREARDKLQAISNIERDLNQQNP